MGGVGYYIVEGVVKLKLERKWLTTESTIGELTIEGDDQFKLYTLELPWLDNKSDVSCIPMGLYEVAMLPSYRFNHYMPTLLHVPKRSGVLIHVGNYPRDTQGCILIGMLRQANAVTDSRRAFDLLKEKMKVDEKMMLDIAYASDALD